jgi:hypothetical protein
MMFLGHISFSTAIMTLTIGFVLLAWSKKETNASSLLRFGGTLVIILSLLNFLCIGYYMVRYWQDGYFKAPNIISHDPRMSMMGDMKGMKGMMDEKMKMMPEKDLAKPEENAPLPEGHETHH